MRADSWKQIVKYPIYIVATVYTVGLLAIARVFIPLYIHDCQRFGFMRFTTQLLHEARLRL